MAHRRSCPKTHPLRQADGAAAGFGARWRRRERDGLCRRLRRRCVTFWLWLLGSKLTPACGLDGSARDVTPRYTRAFFNVTLKSRVPTSTRVRKANGGSDWFAGVIEPFGRGFKLVRVTSWGLGAISAHMILLPTLQNRDIEEEEQLWHRQANAPMPTSIGGFKNHPK